MNEEGFANEREGQREKPVLRHASLRGLVFPGHSEQLSVLGMKALHSKWRSLDLFYML